MLRPLATEHFDFIIVHKVDRLARSRADDVALTAAITASGARLVSVTENIDETPSGLLFHGIMSSIAEFYSRSPSERRQNQSDGVSDVRVLNFELLVVCATAPGIATALPRADDGRAIPGAPHGVRPGVCRASSGGMATFLRHA